MICKKCNAIFYEATLLFKDDTLIVKCRNCGFMIVIGRIENDKIISDQITITKDPFPPTVEESRSKIEHDKINVPGRHL